MAILVTNGHYTVVQPVRSIWPYAVKPQYALTDAVWRSGRWGLEDADQVIIDAEQGCCYPTPVNIEANNILKNGLSENYDTELALAEGAGDYNPASPNIVWKLSDASTALDQYAAWPRRAPDQGSPMYIEIVRMPTSAMYEFEIDSTSVSPGEEEETPPKLFPCMCAAANINFRAAPPVSLLPGDPPTSTFEPSVSVRFNLTYYKIDEALTDEEEEALEEPPVPTPIMQADLIVIQRRDRIEIKRGDSSDVIMTVTIQKVKPDGEDSAEASSIDQPLNVELRTIGSVLELHFPFEVIKLPISSVGFSPPGYVVITGLSVRLDAVESASFRAWPRWFPLSATIGSRTASLGFHNENFSEPRGFWLAEPDPDITPQHVKRWKVNAPGNWAGPTVDYSLSLSKEMNETIDGDISYVPYIPLAPKDLTRYVRPLKMMLVEWYPETTVDDAVVEEVKPLKIEVSHVFDRDALTVDSRATLVFNTTRQNWQGTGISAAQRWLFRGLSGVTIDLDRQPDIGSWRVFSGLANLSSFVSAHGGAVPTVSVDCEGRAVSLMSPRWDLPWMDGWNIFYAMSFLAALGGIAREDLRFEPHVPGNPFEDLGDADGNPAFFLPIGPASGDLTRFSGQPLWLIMMRIAKMVGYTLFFDAYGKLAFEKYREPEGVKRFFYEDEVQAQSLDACWSLSVSRDMRQMRNETILIGPQVGAYKVDPLVESRRDQNSVDDPNAFNYLGFRNPSVYVDTLFITEEFASEAADAIHAVERVPPARINLTTWLSPDIYPLDVIQVESERFATAGTRLLVMGVRHVMDPNLSYTEISAELTFEFALADPPEEE